MGWFGGLFGSSAEPSPDPFAKLDPRVRAFLQKESPVKYQQAEATATSSDQFSPTRPPSSPQHAVSPTSQPAHEASTTTATTSSTQPPAPFVPPESLFQDGRYAHLWKTYRPLAAIEAETKSDHERLMDVLDAYKERRAQIGRAALENCALEQIDWNTCIKTGPLKSRMTMCHAEMKKFERCYNMQSRLLKALGYLSTYDRPPEVDERIQIHADTLYHRMLEQEAAQELAKAEGRPVPEATDFATSLTLPAPPAPTHGVTDPATSTTDVEDIPEDIRKQWDARLAKLPENERPAEEAALRAEVQARAEMAGRVTALRAAQAAERERRKTEGQATLVDRVTGLFSGK
ncbi:hypothetical protein SPI_07039 [Niveomyces insectorum RCEF 264]|uniref:Autophagy protein n=1 Tax=Niveomyces insectorum RCEF 264 TaxID=1081102 RepID=A0A167Q7R3_9HYPO|nr:hypothetical protein SPI_07039 [Niveomyces insectorum RCEF 264]